MVETSVAMDRTCLAVLCNAWRAATLEMGDGRTVLRLIPIVAPIKAAVLPLSKKLAEPATAMDATCGAALNTWDLRRVGQHRPVTTAARTKIEHIKAKDLAIYTPRPA